MKKLFLVLTFSHFDSRIRYLILLSAALSHLLTFSQNVGLGTTSPQAKFHIKGTLNASELTIDADTNQTNTNPMIRLRKSDGTDLFWIHSDHPSNFFAGVGAGNDNLPGSEHNIFIGREAGTDNQSGENNTATGSYALTSNTSGMNNVALGSGTLFSNPDGIGNTVVGSQAVFSQTNGSGNTAVGYTAMYQMNEGNYNVAFGYEAGDNLVEGIGNTFVGGWANTPSPAFQVNANAIGADVFASAGQVRIGSGVTSIGGPQNWTNYSDARIKQDVRADVPGLTFIRLLSPVTYTKSLQLEREIAGAGLSKIYGNENPYKDIRYSGFIAQDVEAAAKSIGYDFSGVDAPQKESGLYGLRYAEFVVPLVKAMQEQQAMIEAQQQQIALLIQEIELLKRRVKSEE